MVINITPLSRETARSITTSLLKSGRISALSAGIALITAVQKSRFLVVASGLPEVGNEFKFSY